ncbi:MAG: hypothetical protein GAK36_00075 [Pseudomonas sp.]|nr:MAG: hypothetical protein GAK36_00075 [Pseudomonas sp.]
MSHNQEEMTVGELVNGDDLEFLRELAAEKQVTVQQLIKEGIQQVIATRTRPKPMKGAIQAFRRR